MSDKDCPKSEDGKHYFIARYCEFCSMWEMNYLEQEVSRLQRELEDFKMYHFQQEQNAFKVAEEMSNKVESDLRTEIERLRKELDNIIFECEKGEMDKRGRAGIIKFIARRAVSPRVTEVKK